MLCGRLFCYGKSCSHILVVLKRSLDHCKHSSFYVLVLCCFGCFVDSTPLDPFFFIYAFAQVKCFSVRRTKIVISETFYGRMSLLAPVISQEILGASKVCYGIFSAKCLASEKCKYFARHFSYVVIAGKFLIRNLEAALNEL